MRIIFGSKADLVQLNPGSTCLTITGYPKYSVEEKKITTTTNNQKTLKMADSSSAPILSLCQS